MKAVSPSGLWRRRNPLNKISQRCWTSRNLPFIATGSTVTLSKEKLFSVGEDLTERDQRQTLREARVCVSVMSVIRLRSKYHVVKQPLRKSIENGKFQSADVSPGNARYEGLTDQDGESFA